MAMVGKAGMRPKVSVVICAYSLGRWEDLRRAIQSVQTQTQVAEEIVLVVDHCPELLKQANHLPLDIIVIPNRFEKGPSGARNTGAARARGDIVAFLDDDAAADPDWLTRIMSHYEDPRILGVCGMMRPDWEDGRPKWFPSELDWVVGCSYQGMSSSSAPVRSFIAANMSFRRVVLQDSGGFSHALGRVDATPFGCEETELCLRISQRNPDGILLYEPAAAVRHRVSNQRATWSYLRSRCYAEGLSKAMVVRLAGPDRALASERAFVRSAITRGIWRSLADAARGKLAGALAALALVVAVAVTATGYLVGMVTRRGGSADSAAISNAPGAAANGHHAGLAAVSGRPEADTSRLHRRAAIIPWIGLAGCIALWASALRGVNVARIGSAELGLVSVLPITFWAALAGLMASFSWAVTRRESRWPILAAHLLTLVIILHATPAILYGTLRYSWAWKHTGVVDYIANNGIHFNLGGELGVYQGWPGFFALNAFLTQASGLHTALGYAPWVLVLNNLLWLGPVILIARAFTSDQRLIWTTAWLFELGNWVGQDYFSPQAFTFFLYLTVIAVCLRWLWHPRIGPPPMTETTDTAEYRQPQRWAMVLCLVPMMAAIASSHQLTPFMLLGALILLVVFRQLRPRTLPLVMAAITVGWIMYGGLPWLKVNSAKVFSGMGDPWANIGLHIVGQGQVPTGQILVDWGSRAVSGAIGVLALIGFWRYRRYHDRRARSSWNRLAVLAVAALPAAVANSYGGEIIFRVYLFALPFMAVAAAAAFFPTAERSWSTAPVALLTVVTIMLIGGFSLGNYGQEAINHLSPNEVAAASWLYRTAPRGAELISVDSNYPYAFVHYDWYDYGFLDATASSSRTVLRAPVKTVTRVMADSSGPAYLILTDSQSAAVRLDAIWAPGAYERVTHALLTSPNFKLVYRNGDAMILQLAR
jgi:glycosyltransferase involved in cell wall biosynthesis